MDNAACQTCHERRYDSFATDHPDFARWPYERRTPIAFDHASHSTKHFPEKKQGFACRQCHLEDQAQSSMLTAGYASTCASCHDEEIATSAARGVPMFSLPTLDVDALQKAGHDIGPWPAGATGDFDGRLPPPMKLLLAAEPAAARAIARLGEDFDFFDVDPDDAEQLAACAALAAAIKKLIQELSESGPAAAQKRLADLSEHLEQDDKASRLVAGLSFDTLRPAAQAWLKDSPNGAREVPQSTDESAGSWYYDAATWSIRYRPLGHADPILTGWLTALTESDRVRSRPLVLAMLKEMSKPTAPGLCASCHSIEQQAAGQLAIHWRPADRAAVPRSFTKFSHGPHVLLPELADCTACHTINGAADTSKAYASWSATSFASEFRPIAKRQCAACHVEKAAGDSCTQCHNYHVNVEGLGLMVESPERLSRRPQYSTFNSQPSTLNPLKISSGTRPVPR
jgi:hypothetical protein